MTNICILPVQKLSTGKVTNKKEPVGDKQDVIGLMTSIALGRLQCF